MELHPKYLEMLRTHFGQERLDSLIKAYALPPVRGLKMNAYKNVNLPFNTTPSQLNSEILIPETYKDAVVHPFHHAGAYYIQDPSATLPVVALNPEATDCVLDMCSAPGGKATQILNAIPDGFLISNEMDQGRAQRLKGNLERWGVEHCAVVQEAGQDLPKHFQSVFDKVLLDAPCSGEGLYRRQPEHALSYNMKTIHTLVTLQTELLEAAYLCCADGGVIVYSTCTLNPYENEGVLEAFLKKYPQCTLEETGILCGEPGLMGLTLARRVFPSEQGEGHFIARVRIQKKEGRNRLQFRAPKHKKLVVNGVTFEGNMEKRQDTLVILKSRGFLKTSAKVIYDGLEFAHETKHTTILQGVATSVAYALSVPAHEVSITEAYRYLYGHTIENPKQGYARVVYQGTSIGLIKGSNNKYPKHLRNKFDTY